MPVLHFELCLFWWDHYNFRFSFYSHHRDTNRPKMYKDSFISLNFGRLQILFYPNGRTD